MKIKKLLAVLLAAALLAGMLTTPVAARRYLSGREGGIEREYGDYVFSKISNPGTGARMPDGINTNDDTGFGPNRLNSYAWAVASRGDYIYIGTNRTLFGSALNAVGETLVQKNPSLTQDKLDLLVTYLSGGEVPVGLAEEDYVPQIIRFDVNNGSTKVIYRPATVRGEDGALYYADKDGNIIPTARVVSETASFRSVIEFKGNLYFGSLGTHMLQLVRIDEEDKATVVHQTLGLISSLRACCIYGEGDEETVFFGGQDTTYRPWLAYRRDHGDDGVMPIVIRRLDPATAGTGSEDWSGIVADFRDFGKYAAATVYSTGGGNVWDLCSYNGRLYIILAYDRGWAMFRGEQAAPGDPDANQFGWKWTEIVGDESVYGYPLAMDANVGALNAEFARAYGCTQYAPALKSTGLLESTATPFVYNGKMYIGSFDNATSIQTESLMKLIVKLTALISSRDSSETGPSLAQIFAPIYQVLSHQQHVWVMDENEQIAPVEGANALLRGTTNDYVWRFAALDGKLYTGTFDSATAFNYFLSPIFFSDEQQQQLLTESDRAITNELLTAVDDSNIGQLRKLLDGIPAEELGLSDEAVETLETAKLACDLLYNLFGGDIDVESLASVMTTLQRLLPVINYVNPGISPEVVSLLNWLVAAVDVEGLQYWAMARALVDREERGFDLFVTSDGEQWEAVVRDGLGDPYNYGARTFTIFDDALYIGTANPYFGAQLWRVSMDSPALTGAVAEDGESLSYTVTGAPENAVLIAARYDGGRMTGMGSTSVSGDAEGTLTVGGSGEEYRMFLLDGDSYAPLCEEWKS